MLMKQIHQLRKNVIDLKLNNAKMIKSKPFTIQELNEVLKMIKEGKARDPEGISRDIFSLNKIGHDLKMSLLMMMNSLYPTL